ncbi:hypothetical protein CXG81DRAFT_21088 [Caulochytrium protostelioides]|uniref:Uncharacterized protein n=1 Tax=Caulochytrium protostelioides TaxID=1555241 RepID=A0A4P9X1F5_9FUNG|nr:hypothetical protein CXG81DRAFT_21088 [Caulochytrium protostelioides]|eukprot:RKO98733.1 hypothetical protein CXG81DRAFT_21088 [Caulochytrium protostelioides]
MSLEDPSAVPVETAVRTMPDAPWSPASTARTSFFSADSALEPASPSGRDRLSPGLAHTTAAAAAAPAAAVDDDDDDADAYADAHEYETGASDAAPSDDATNLMDLVPLSDAADAGRSTFSGASSPPISFDAARDDVALNDVALDRRDGLRLDRPVLSESDGADAADDAAAGGVPLAQRAPLSDDDSAVASPSLSPSQAQIASWKAPATRALMGSIVWPSPPASSPTSSPASSPPSPPPRPPRRVRAVPPLDARATSSAATTGVPPPWPPSPPSPAELCRRPAPLTERASRASRATATVAARPLRWLGAMHDGLAMSPILGPGASVSTAAATLASEAASAAWVPHAGSGHLAPRSSSLRSPLKRRSLTQDDVISVRASMSAFLLVRAAAAAAARSSNSCSSSSSRVSAWCADRPGRGRLEEGVVSALAPVSAAPSESSASSPPASRTRSPHDSGIVMTDVIPDSPGSASPGSGAATHRSATSTDGVATPLTPWNNDAVGAGVDAPYPLVGGAPPAAILSELVGEGMSLHRVLKRPPPRSSSYWHGVAVSSGPRCSGSYSDSADGGHDDSGSGSGSSSGSSSENGRDVQDHVPLARRPPIVTTRPPALARVMAPTRSLAPFSDASIARRHLSSALKPPDDGPRVDLAGAHHRNAVLAVRQQHPSLNSMPDASPLTSTSPVLPSLSTRRSALASPRSISTASLGSALWSHQQRMQREAAPPPRPSSLAPPHAADPARSGKPDRRARRPNLPRPSGIKWPMPPRSMTPVALANSWARVLRLPRTKAWRERQRQSCPDFGERDACEGSARGVA